MNPARYQDQPTISQLNNLIKKIPKYPISVGRLIELARDTKEPKEVQSFYESFARDLEFDGPEDLKDRSEQVELMRQEEKEMPPEQQVAPEEY